MKRQDGQDPYYDRLFDPPRSDRPTTERGWLSVAGPRSSVRLYVIPLLLFGVFVLPHFTIAGRHWHFWVF